jgi:pimeloyl-ACP methyl ester carboxylesterase
MYMPARAIGDLNPALLAQCPVVEVPRDADRLPVHITEWGDTGPPVLLVHGGVQGGIGGGPDNFAGQKPLAEKGWQLRLIDRPGFGRSPSRGPDDMAADAVLIADRLGASSHLLGHSFGGAGALLAAASRPEAVRSLILVEPALQPMLLTDPESAADPASRAATEIIMKHLMSCKTPADYSIGFLSALGSSPEGGENMVAASLKADPKRATDLGCSLLRARMASPADMRAAADTVLAAKIPVLVISGGYSAGQETAANVIARLMGGRHAVVAAPSHFLQQDSPEAFNTAVDAFLREVEARLQG